MVNNYANADFHVRSRPNLWSGEYEHLQSIISKLKEVYIPEEATLVFPAVLIMWITESFDGNMLRKPKYRNRAVLLLDLLVWTCNLVYYNKPLDFVDRNSPSLF